MVRGFIDANASVVRRHPVARQFLGGDAVSAWSDSDGVTVISGDYAPVQKQSGTVQVQPQPQQAWAAQADLRNTLAGAWDQGRLPVDSLQARALYSAGAWNIESLTGSMAGGQVQLTGNVKGALWTGQARRGREPSR